MCSFLQVDSVARIAKAKSKKQKENKRKENRTKGQTDSHLNGVPVALKVPPRMPAPGPPSGDHCCDLRFPVSVKMCIPYFGLL